MVILQKIKDLHGGNECYTYGIQSDLNTDDNPGDRCSQYRC